MGSLLLILTDLGADLEFLQCVSNCTQPRTLAGPVCTHFAGHATVLYSMCRRVPEQQRQVHRGAEDFLDGHALQPLTQLVTPLVEQRGDDR